MAKLRNHPQFELRDDAAAAFDAYEAKYGKRKVNSARRTEAQQQTLINRWDKGGPANRPPYLYEPARPARTSNHVKEGGIAVDVADWQEFKKHCEEFGFYWYGAGDVVHFEYRGRPSSGGNNPAPNQVTKDRQAFLNSRGWKLDVDGIEGPKTKQAYKEYQTYLKGRGWYSGAIDGIWGNGTQAAHAKFWTELNPTTGHQPVTYRSIQIGLNKFGYGLVVDGIWGRKSSNALADFQRKHGLVVDRIVGPKTRAALGI